MPKIILASKSPRRKQLLEWAEIPVDIVASDVDEIFPADLPIAEVPVFIARRKANAVREGLPHNEQIILAADTIVVLENEVIGKPVDRADAIEILKALSGKTHQVITGVVLLHEGNEIAFADTTEVIFHELTEEQITFYVDHYQPYDKAGAYAIQEWIGVVGIQSINGDFYNVMGLPVSRVIRELNKLM
ncbi:MAG TPA: Maf family nucleotide pyrophosphatase [Parafilimonas sp.]|nr:Maf family nucleotide pyrophosphatase [Parafilimonas sp.]